MSELFVNPLKYSQFQTPASPIYIAETIFTDDIPLGFHTHDFYEVFFITSGILNHHINGQIEYIHEHSYQLILPEYVHGLATSTPYPTRIVNLAFPKELFTEDLMYLLERITRSSAPIPSTSVHSTDWSTFLSKIQQISQCMDYEEIKIRFRHLLGDILLHFLDQLRKQDHNRPYWLIKTLEKMQLKTNFNKDLQHFVRLSDRTQEHLTRELKKHYNLTPSQYLNGLKLDESATLLSTTNLSILEIQLECGFHNTSYFNSRFKEKYGLTPSQYRKKNRSIF